MLTRERGNDHKQILAVIGCFKQLVLFEQDRQENDTRVTGVILAQTAMMRILLEYVVR